jgi:D-alanyl-D-alanine carboxypeptidase
VVTGQPTSAARFQAAQALAESAAQNLLYETVVARGQVVGRYAAPWDETAPVAAGDEIRLVRWRDERPTVELNLDKLSVPAEKGTVVGEIVASGKKVNAVLAGAIRKPSVWWKLGHWEL